MSLGVQDFTCRPPYCCRRVADDAMTSLDQDLNLGDDFAIVTFKGGESRILKVQDRKSMMFSGCIELNVGSDYTADWFRNRCTNS